MNQKLEITKRRERLQGRMDDWNAKAAEYLQSADLDVELDLQDILDRELPGGSGGSEDAGDGDVDTVSESESESDAEANSNAEVVEIPPAMSKWRQMSAENQTLYLPSSFPAGTFPDPSSSELSLRQGQANDALHNLRIALGKKSFLFRTNIRSAKSQQKKTRAWSEVNSVDGVVRYQAKIYNATRRKMIHLGAEEKIMDRYKILTQGQLKVSTAIATPNARGQRNFQLAWFWNMDSKVDTQSDDWMEECEFPPCSNL